MLALAPATTACAAEHALGAGKLSVDGSVYVGTAIRADDQDRKLLPDLNSSLVGIEGNSQTPGTGRNQDDGNLNFNRGDPVTTMLKGYLALAYEWHDFGIEASAQAWYDYATARSSHPWGNERNGFAPGRPLGDSGADARTKFSGVVLDNLYLHGHHRSGDVALDWRLGYQALDWGKRFVVLGGLREIMPLDLPASLRPGAVRGKETFIPIPMVLARISLPNATNLEAFYQLRYQRTALSQCGTFFSPLDFIVESCNKAMVGNISDRTAVATNTYIKRGDTVEPRDAGQGGIALRHTVADWSTEFGLYAAQFHSRLPFYSGTKSLRPGPPFIPGDPGNLNPTYFTEYPERIRMFGATIESKLSRGLVFGELTYRPNQPLQYNPVDVIAGAVSLTAPTPLRAKIDAVEPGGVLRAWERHEALQLQFGAGTEIPGVLGSAGLSLGGEIVYKRVLDLPNPAVVRFGRSEVFGQGPVDGVCPPPAAPVACSVDGFVSPDAFGYRLRASLRYPKAVAGVDLQPSVFFSHDVTGWAGDYLVNEGRMLANVALLASFGGHWSASIAWQPTWGGTYNGMRDRSTAQAYVGYQF